ncbi:hypothetical protein Tco_0371138 [Tanacetum coccineum]
MASIRPKNSLSIEEKATLFQQHLEKIRKHFEAKRAEEKRNKPPTKSQQRKIMCTYLKNMEGYKLKDLKFKELIKSKRFSTSIQRGKIHLKTLEQGLCGRKKREQEQMPKTRESKEVKVNRLTPATPSYPPINGQQ